MSGRTRQRSTARLSSTPRKSAAHISTSFTSAQVESMRISSHSSRPSMFGIWSSISAMSKLPPSSSVSASGPEPAVTTVMPAPRR